MDAFAADGDAMHLAGHALGFTDVLAGLLNEEAIGCGVDGNRAQEHEDVRKESEHSRILW